MKVSAIVAYSANFAIGKAGQMPWHLPADLRHFRRITEGHAIVMGRKTFESIGRPLPKRTNIVLSKTMSGGDGYLVCGSIEAAIEYATQINENELFIIGGGEIYKQALAYCREVYATEIDLGVEDADTHFPDLAAEGWVCVEEEAHEADDKNAYGYVFKRWARA